MAYGWVIISYVWVKIDDLVQDCSISSVLAMEILKSCNKPSKCSWKMWWVFYGATNIVINTIFEIAINYNL